MNSFGEFDVSPYKVIRAVLGEAFQRWPPRDIQWWSQDVLMGGLGWGGWGWGGGGGSNQAGVAQKSSLFQYKNVVENKVLDYVSA